jgi:hypothetical protein
MQKDRLIDGLSNEFVPGSVKTPLTCPRPGDDQKDLFPGCPSEEANQKLRQHSQQQTANDHQKEGCLDHRENHVDLNRCKIGQCKNKHNQDDQTANNLSKFELHENSLLF